MIIFCDTNALVSLLCFPREVNKKPILGHEVYDAVAEGEIELLISDIVANEFRRTISKYFPKFIDAIEPELERFGITHIPKATTKLINEIQAISVDPDDVDIIATAIMAAKFQNISYILSNDIETFHSNEMKEFLRKFALTPITLYGLLKLLDKR